MKFQIFYIATEYNTNYKKELKEALLFFINKPENQKITKVFNNLTNNTYIIINEDEIDLSFSALDDTLLFYDNFFMYYISILKMCDNNTYLINIKNQNEYDIIKNQNDFFIHDKYNFSLFGSFGLSLIVINNIAHLLLKDTTDIIFKYKTYTFETYMRTIKLKQML